MSVNWVAWLRGYPLAVMSSALAGLLTGLVAPFMGNASFLEFFHMAIVLSAFRGGLGPGMLAATLSFFILDYFFIPPPNAFALGPHLVRLVLFEAVAVLTSFLSGKLKSATQRIERAQAELEDRIRQRTEELSRTNDMLLTEVTQRKEAEKAILEVSAREQRRLGQDLHDGLCQTIAGVRLMVEDLGREDDGRAPVLERIERQLTEALDQAYTISRGLYPVELDTNGLMSALEELAARLSTVHRVQCQFRCRQPVSFRDNTMATHLYRIAQEAVVNGIKGGKASRINIGLVQRGGRGVLMIADNGAGLGNGSARKGMGITMMEHRARMIGAELRFRSRRRGGTVVTCSFPMRSGPDAKSHEP